MDAILKLKNMPEMACRRSVNSFRHQLEIVVAVRTA